MAVKFNGTLPVKAVAVHTTSAKSTQRVIHLQATKDVLVDALACAKGLQTAADKIGDATFALDRDTLTIQTTISAALLPMLINADAHAVMRKALDDRGATDVKLEVLPAPAKEPVAARSSTPDDNPATGKSYPVSNPSSLERLMRNAEGLNKVSDQMTAQVEQMDAVLKRLNLGVSAWVTILEDSDEEGNWSKEEIGYARIGSRWGIALRSQDGSYGSSEPDEETFAAFADAPRQLRMRAIEFVPLLIEQLSTEAESLMAKLSPKVEEFAALTSAMKSVSGVK